jgi:deoxyribodipyrimidine photolyase-related protein
MKGNTFVILGNQLFDPKLLKDKDCEQVFMAEDFGLCTYENHHKLKIYLFLCAMREYKDELNCSDVQVHYQKLNTSNKSYAGSLLDFLNINKITHINFFEIEDKVFEKKIYGELKKNKISYEVHQSPMFFLSREEFASEVEGKKNLRMAGFYQRVRKQFGVLLDDHKKPLGGKWSLDEENRKKIPKGTVLPKMPELQNSVYHEEICSLVTEHFIDHPGNLDHIWFPVTRKDAEKCFDDFLSVRMNNFGAYEDAMVEGKNFLFHSGLSAAMNIGILSPITVIQKVLASAENLDLPLNSVEGFIRQIIGWREFIRGVYQTKGDYQESRNYWNHHKNLTGSWYDGSTGIVPLDDCIQSTLQDGYAHHIPRLMVISNLMNLCEIDPKQIYKWFMEMYIDSSEWVMVPNVFGMATYADGGIMSTKPYTCGSNYMLKMSNYKKGDWCDVVDGLYWRFTEKNRSFYEANARLALQIRALDRMKEERKSLIFEKAEEFIKIHTA